MSLRVDSVKSTGATIAIALARHDLSCRAPALALRLLPAGRMAVVHLDETSPAHQAIYTTPDSTLVERRHQIEDTDPDRQLE